MSPKFFLAQNSAMNGTILGEIFGNIHLYSKKVLKIVLFWSNFLYLSSWAQKKSLENSSFHRAFFCAAEKSNIKSTILGAIGVPEPL